MLVHTHQRPQSAGWKTTLDITFHRKTDLQIRQICLRLKTFGALWLQLFVPAQRWKHWRHSKVIFRNLKGQFLWPWFKISSVQCLTDWRQSSETMETLIRTNICASVTDLWLTQCWHYQNHNAEFTPPQLSVGWVRFNIPLNTLEVISGTVFLPFKWPNQQCQSTEGRCSRIRLQSYQVHPTVLQQYNT